MQTSEFPLKILKSVIDIKIKYRRFITSLNSKTVVINTIKIYESNKIGLHPRAERCVKKSYDSENPIRE